MISIRWSVLGVIYYIEEFKLLLHIKIYINKSCYNKKNFFNTTAKSYEKNIYI